jgi:hypothetical protein
VIAGDYSDAGNVFHGFVRAPNGAITTFDAPGAGTGSGQGTLSAGINPAGTVTGAYFDASNVYHGYVRASDGTITTIDVPGAGTGPLQGTIGEAINPVGTIPGNYIDASSANHGFVRDKHGGLTTFDAPGAGTGIGQGTIPLPTTRRGRSSDTTLMGAMYFTASSWKASKPCERVWKPGESTFKERHSLFQRLSPPGRETGGLLATVNTCGPANLDVIP